MKRRGFDHPLGKKPLPEPLSSEKLQRYYKFLRYSKVERSRKLAATRIIMSHVRLGMSLVGNMMLHYPTKSDLLVAEMLYILTHGVDMIRNGALDKHEGEPNITGYLITTIAKHLQHSADQDRLMLGAGRAKGKTVRVSPLTRDVVTNEQLLNEKGVPRYEYEAALNQCLMPIERTVLELRVEGWNDTQIGEKLNCTKQYVQRVRAELAERIRSDHD